MNQYTVFLSFKSNRTFFEYVYRIIFWMKKKSHNLRTNFWNLRTNFWNFRPLCVGEISCVNSLMIGSTFKSSDIWGQTILSHRNRSHVWLKASIWLIRKETFSSNYGRFLLSICTLICTIWLDLHLMKDHAFKHAEAILCTPQKHTTCN